MRIVYWMLIMACIVGLWFSESMHNWLAANASWYKMSSAGLMQAMLGVFAGLFTAKASDASSELKRLMDVPEISSLLDRANLAKTKREEEENRYQNLVSIVRKEAQQQYARDMLIMHRDRLLEHWTEIQSLQAMLDSDASGVQLDPDTHKHIMHFIVKTRFVDYMGRGFLRQIPVLGGLMDYLLGPLWEAYYSKNVSKLTRLLNRDKGDNSPSPGKS